MYSFFYNHTALKNVLVIVMKPESKNASFETRGNVVAIYDDNHELIGINILHIDEVMKIKANGIIFTPGEKLLEIVNSILTKEGFEPLPPITDSGYKVGVVTKIEEHQGLFNVSLSCGENQYRTTSKLGNMKVGSKVVAAMDGAILYNGSQFHRNANNDVRIMNASELHIEGKEDEAFLLDDDQTYISGEDFFLR